MITQKSATVVPLTRELAHKHATMVAMTGERELKPLRLAHFAELIESGDFGCPVWSVAVVKTTGKEYRADGQHTSNALAQIDEDKFPVGRTLTYQVFEIDSLEEDAPALFYWFDNSQSARSKEDYIGLYIAQHPDIGNLSRKFTLHAMAAVDYYLKDLNKRQVDHTKWQEVHVPQYHGLYLENSIYREFAVWLHRWTKTKNGWMIPKSAIVAEMLADWLSHPEMATTFWNFVFTNSHPDVNHASRLLSDQFNEFLRRPRRPGPIQFRSAAHKMWERFRRNHEAEVKAAAKTQQPSLPSMPPPSMTIESRPSV